MKRAILAAVLILASSVAFADAASVLLDGEKVRSMSAEEYAAVVRSAPDVNVRSENGGSTPLHLVASAGTPENIAALVCAGADVNVRNNLGWIPLHLAARFGIPDNIAALVSAGADVEAHK
jgi:ankyrin repeat protein